jgi:hypothetical protein
MSYIYIHFLVCVILMDYISQLLCVLTFSIRLFYERVILGDLVPVRLLPRRNDVTHSTRRVSQSRTTTPPTTSKIKIVTHVEETLPIYIYIYVKVRIACSP